MNEQENSPAIRAGESFVAAFADDPQVQRSMAMAAFRRRAFAAGINAIGVTQRQVMETIGSECAAFQNLLKEFAGEQGQWIWATLAPLQAAQEQAFAELTAEIQQSHDQLKDNLAAHGFDPPNGLEVWEGLARLADKEPGAMTIAEIYDWAIAWAKREALRLKIARGETPILSASHSPVRRATRKAEDASVRRDEHDVRIAWCVGKRIYLGHDTQVSRLFWLLALPVGRAHTLAEVQRAIDGIETSRDMDATGEEYQKASQRVRKAISKLRAAIEEGGAADHVLIVRGGSQIDPEYTLVLRFGELE
jgi:hypothetical protein